MNKTNPKTQALKYIFFDLITAALSWSFFYFFRKVTFETHTIDFIDPNYFLGVTLIPIFWIMLYYASGYYNNLFRKSRFSEIGNTLISTFIGTLIIFFTSILDDQIIDYTDYYTSFTFLFTIHFVLTYIPRMIITNITTHKVRRGKITFNCIIIGSNNLALELYHEIKNQKKSTGEQILGFLTVNGKTHSDIHEYIPRLGSTSDLDKIIQEYQIEDVIIAIETSEHEQIGNIITRLSEHNVNIKLIPDMLDIITGNVRIINIIGTPFIQISNSIMPEWQKSIKHFMDISISLFCLIISLPLSISLAIAIKLTSKGPVFYSHDRIGKYGKPFRIIKFRSMHTDAERNGPQLSSKDDNRTTKIGRVMRKIRLDEIPNFINVLKGDMSLVGPRPERQFYIDQITQQAPQYVLLHKIKPGITSLGQVKYGYAENVDQMVKRLRYDLLYLENMSIFLDFKILAYTILIIFRGHGV